MKMKSNLSLQQRRQALKELAHLGEVELARRNSNDFNGYVLKDEKGQRIIQAEIHEEINWHIDECQKRKLNCGILAPWRHGKTEQVVIGRTLRLLGENPNNRVSIVCNTDDNAAARVGAISKYIENSDEYKEVYPHVVPGDKAQWGRHKLVIQRESIAKDGSVEAWGITTSGTGSGCDYLIIDDPVDLRNAILNPALRSQVKESLKNVWFSRLAPKGFKIYIATVWHLDDATTELRNSPEWCFLVIKVSEDFSCFECESPLKGRFTIPLWSAQWPKNRLIQQCKDLGSTSFNRGYRQNAISDENRTMPSYLRVFKYGTRRQDIINKDWPRVGGMDPFGKFVVIFTLALAPNGMKYPIDIRRGKWGPTKAVEELIDSYFTYQHQLIAVENNAAQEAIVQWALEKGNKGMPLWPFFTGAQKADPRIGLPGMEVEFANDSWLCPMGDMHEPDCKCNFCVWKNELASHPVGETADVVMASWLAREAARALQLGIYEDNKDQETVETAEDVGIERVNIGEY